MMAFSLLGVLLSLLGNLSPDALPADALAQPMLAGAPKDTLVAVYIPDFNLDYGAFADSPSMAMLFGEWPPEEDEDFPKALAAYSIEDLFSLFRSEAALFLTPPVPNSEWMEPELFLVMRPFDPEVFELMDALAEELGVVELAGGLKGLAGESEWDPLMAYSDEFIYVADRLELLVQYLDNGGETLINTPRFTAATVNLPRKLALFAYVDLHGLLRLPVTDWWTGTVTEPELTPFEERLETVVVGVLPGEDGKFLAELNLAEGEPVELLEAFGAVRQMPDLIGRYPGDCLIAVEVSLEKPVSTVARLMLTTFQEKQAYHMDEASSSPYGKYMHEPPPPPPPPETEPEIPPEILAALEELDDLAGYTVGMSLHALPGEPQSEMAENFLDDMLDLELEYADPRVAFYLQSSDPAALADGLVELLSEMEGDQLPEEEVEVGGVSGRLLMLEEEKYLYLLELDGLLLVTPDELSAEFVIENFDGAGALATEEAFTGSSANVAEPVNLVAWMDMQGLLEAIHGSEPDYMTGFVQSVGEFGLHVSVLGDRITLVADSPMVGFMMGLFAFGF